jgi:hypothetical protein
MFIPPLPEHVVLAAQQLPPIHVIVQQPPATGMPEWVKIIISAVVGAALAIGGNIVMEIIKRKMVGRLAARQLSAELVDKLSMIASADQFWRKYESADPKVKFQVATVVIETLKRDRPERYVYFANNQQSVIYELEAFEELRRFNRAYDQFATVTEGDYFFVLSLDLEYMTKNATKFLQKHSPAFVLHPEENDGLFELELEALQSRKSGNDVVGG